MYIPTGLVGINPSAQPCKVNPLDRLQHTKASDLLIFIPLFISSVKISRYCYKHDIKMHIYAHFSAFMHRLYIPADKPTYPRGKQGRLPGGGGYPSKYPKQEKSPIHFSEADRANRQPCNRDNRVFYKLFPYDFCRSIQYFYGCHGCQVRRNIDISRV